MEKRVGVAEAFAAFGATLEDPEFAFSAVAPDGSVVISLWAHKLMWGPDSFSYMNHLTRWRENQIGARLFAKHLKRAWADKCPLRLVIASAGDTIKVEQSMNLDRMVKVYTARPDMVGSIASFDGNDFVLEFAPIQPAAKGSSVVESRRPAPDR